MLKKLTNLTSIDVNHQCYCWFTLIIFLLFEMIIIPPTHCRQYHSNIYTGSRRRAALATAYARQRSIADIITPANSDDYDPLTENSRNDPRTVISVPDFNADADSAAVVEERRSRRDATSAKGESASFDMPGECYQRYTNSDHHHSLVEWLHHKNSSHYSPISPSYHQALLKLQTDELSHGLQVTSGASACSSRKMRVISSSTPLRERAVCQFEYILNYKPNRIPSTFTEVKCSCPRPSGNIIGKRMFECEPLRYQVRVLLFDEECLSFTEHTETIALACIPVLQANVNADERADVIIPVQTALEIPT